MGEKMGRSNRIVMIYMIKENPVNHAPYVNPV